MYILCVGDAVQKVEKSSTVIFCKYLYICRFRVVKFYLFVSYLIVFFLLLSHL